MAYSSYQIRVVFPGGRELSGQFTSRADAVQAAAKAQGKGLDYEAWGLTENGKRRALRLGLEPLHPRE